MRTGIGFIFTGMNGTGGRMEAADAAERLKNLRLKAGLDPEGLADQIGITPEWYLDLEGDPEELEAGLDLGQLRKLAVLLHVGMGYLLTGEAVPESVPVLPFLEVARRLRLLLEHSKDVQSLEEKTGWDLTGFLKRPEADGWEQRPPFFRDVCRELEVDWRGVLRYCESFREEE